MTEKKKYMGIAALGILSAVVLGACANIAPVGDEGGSGLGSEESAAMDSNGNEMRQAESGNGVVGTAQASELYEEYSEAKFEEYLGEEPVAVFFHASWCPTCRKLESSILERIDEFPEGTKILKADYDTEEALKREYEINMQSHVLLFDENGELVFKKLDPPVDELKAEFEKALSGEEASADAGLVTVAKAAPLFEEYRAEKYEEYLGKEPMALFFHATWCPTCRNLKEKIEENIDNYPEGTKILMLDYDTEEELKKLYGVNMQSTVVVLDENGEVVYKGLDPAMETLQSEIAGSL